MATIEMNNQRDHKGVQRLIKKTTRVDLTPMVDLGFLLITFFVFTSTMAQPTAMNLNLPKDTPANDPIAESCVLTVLLTKNNMIQYYEGFPRLDLPVATTTYAPADIRQLIQRKKQRIKETKGTADDFVLIIKPAEESSFQNFVDIIDEVTINGIKHYYVAEMDDIDRQLLLFAKI